MCATMTMGKGARLELAREKSMIAKRRKTTSAVQFLTREEGWQILDEQARRSLGMSAEEFVRAWNAGEIDDPDRPEVMHVAMLLPLAR